LNPWARLAEIVAAHGAGALVTVHEARGSAPRDAGARLVVRPDGAFHGTIGGGRLEWEALHAARAALAEGRGPARAIVQALGPDLGQCCGGRVTLLVETFDRRDAPGIEALARGEGEAECRWDEGRVKRAVIPSPVQEEGGPRVSEGRERVWATGAWSSSVRQAQSDRDAGGAHLLPTPPEGGPTLSLNGRGKAWREPLAPALTPLALFGAGHVGRAMALALAPLPFAVRWIDSRDDAFPAHIPANAAPVLAPDPAAEAAALPADALVVIMTHDHALDLAVTAAALRRGFPFVGLIGSDTKRARFERRLAELGLPRSGSARSGARSESPASAARSLR
jgi:xanthine dehydrogenase accessory factor